MIGATGRAVRLGMPLLDDLLGARRCFASQRRDNAAGTRRIGREGEASKGFPLATTPRLCR